MADGIDVREAGLQIAQRGLTDDVRRGRTNREKARDGDTSDADDRDDEPRGRRRREREDDRDDRDDRRDRRRRDDDEDDRPRSRRRDRDEDDDDADEDIRRRDRRDEDDEDDDADTSNRDDGDDEGEDDDRDEDEDDDADGDDDRGNREREFTVKVNGKTERVTERELVAGYQRGRDYHQKTQRLAETDRTYRAGHAQVAEQYSKRLQALGSIVGMLKKSLVGQMDGAQMEHLRRTDETKWLTARADFEKRIKDVDTVFAHLNDEHERHQKDYDAVQAQQRGQMAAYEVERLVAAVPDWVQGRDGKPAGWQRVYKYLQNSGFADTEINPVIDHRMLLIADKARKYDIMMKHSDERGEPKRRSKPVPTRVPSKGSSRNSNRNTSREDRQERDTFTRNRERARKSGDMRDAGDAITSMLTRDERRAQRRNRFR